MKIKFLSLAIACVLALALASCGGTPKPSGDPAKDAKAYVEKVVSLAEGVSSKEDNQKAEETIKKMEEEFEAAYKDKPEDLQKFKDEVEKLLSSGEFRDRMDKAEKAYQEKVKE